MNYKYAICKNCEAKRDKSHTGNLSSYCEDCGEELETMTEDELNDTVIEMAEWPIEIPMDIGVKLDEDISYHIQKQLPFGVNPFNDDGYWAEAHLGRVKFTLELTEDGNYSIKGVKFK